MKMRPLKRSGLLALILSLSLTWEGLLPLTAYADVVSDEAVVESFDETDESAEAELYGDTEAVIEDGEEEIAVVEDEPEYNEQTVSIEESDDTPDTAEGTADMTVMLYSVGSNLEGDSMSATADILEIMEGISMSGIKNPEVNFIVETGGVNTELAKRPRAQVIKDRRDKIKDEYDSVEAGKGDRYLERYDKITTGQYKIAWNKNERFEIHADSLKRTASQPSSPNRLMTRADDSNILGELAEFIITTKEDYPAKQYMLILWDHGGGPLGGLGSDERDTEENGNTFQAWQIAPTMAEAGVTEDDKFAFVNYDACLMGSLENVLAWSPYARYYCGSEDLESNNGDFYENWVSELIKAADGTKIDFSKDTVVDTQMEKTGKTLVEDYYEWYEKREDIGTKSLVKISEASNLGTSVSNFASVCLKLFELDPLETYYGVFDQRAVSQDFHGRDAGIMDLSSFVGWMDEKFDVVITPEVAERDDVKSEVSKMKKAGADIEKSLGKAVLLHKETSKYKDNYHTPGGLTVYFPYIVMNKVTDYFAGYRQIEPSNVLNDYKNFVGVFSAIRTAGLLISDVSKTKSAVDEVLQDTLKSYGLENIYKDKMKDVPTQIEDHRLQNEGMKIYKDENNGMIYYKRRDYKLVDRVCQSPKITINGSDHYLGYLYASGHEIEGDAWRQKLGNFEEKKWFAFQDDGKYIPVAISWIDSGFVNGTEEHGDPFYAGTDLEIPVLYNGSLHILDVGFEEGSNSGKVYGMWPFEYGSRTYGRFISIDSLDKNGEQISILADVPNALEGDPDASYDNDEPQESVIADITLKASTQLYRGVQLCDGKDLTDNVKSMEMTYYMTDLFGAFYQFDKLTETVKVSLNKKSDTKPKNSTLTTEDINLKFEGEKGEYEDSKLKDFKYYYKDEEGNQKELIEGEDGKFYTEEKDEPDGVVDMSGSDTPETSSNGKLKEFKIERDTEIFVLPADINMSNVDKIDEANIDLDKYFQLSTNAEALKVTIEAGDKTVKPVKESDQFTDVSKENAKRALVCDIAPVTYTGKNLVTTQSKSNGSKMIELTLYSDDGQKILREGVDYSVSYKNNKNAADKSAGKSAPTLTITGKGAYSGMKYTAVFTIEKVSLSRAKITYNKQIAPLTKNGVSVTKTVTLPSGVKVPANQCDFEYYEYKEGEVEINIDQLVEWYKNGKEMHLIGIRAKAKEGAQNLIPGTVTEFPPFIVYPKSTGKLSITLENNKVSINDKKNICDFYKNNIKKASIGKDPLKDADLAFLGLYYDSKFSRRYEVTEDDDFTTAGTFYLALCLTPEKQSEYKNFSVVPLKITVTDGTKLKKGDVVLDKTEYKIEDLEDLTEPIDITLKFANGFEWDRLEVICSTRYGGTVSETIDVDDMEDGKIKLENIDNGAPGDYTIEVKGAGKNTGSLKLKYKVK